MVRLNSDVMDGVTAGMSHQCSSTSQKASHSMKLQIKSSIVHTNTTMVPG
eukprot:m.154910 g.154910  ORF g.154910 m.154910 type:complete len:50 (-) comp16263_c0_seq3:177-326(-)